MENKPKIYAFCAAGCKWETVHFSDFEKSACCISQSANADGTFTLLVKKEYKVFAPKNTDGSFNATIIFPYMENGVTKTHTIANAYADEYSDSFVFKLLDKNVNTEATEITLVYEIAGRRYTETISGTALALSGDIIISGATVVHLFNWDATLIGLKGEKGADGEKSPFKLEYKGSGSGSWTDNGDGNYRLDSVGTVNSGDVYLLVDETLGIFGTMSIAFESDYGSYCNELNKKELETNFEYWGLGNFIFVSVWHGYYYIAIENKVNHDLSITLANLKIYKLTVEA